MNEQKEKFEAMRLELIALEKVDIITSSKPDTEIEEEELPEEE